MMLRDDDTAFLLQVLPFLSTLSEKELHLITSAGSSGKFPQGETIISREKECSGLVIVKAGQLRAYFESEDGKEITLYRLLARDVCILTASCILKNISFTVTLEAERDSDVIFIPAAVWEKTLEANGKAKAFSMELVSERFSEVMWVMEQIISKNMGQRIAAFLLEQSVLADSHTLSITHETIAHNLGTAREVVSRTLKYLENDGTLRLSRGQIQLIDLKKLKRTAE